MNSQRRKIAVCAASYVLFSGEILKQKKLKQKRRWWMSSFNKSRTTYNATNMLYDFTKEPSGKFENFCRMSATDFEYLLNEIGHIIGKTDTNMRQCITIQERLAVTLRFLATGDSFTSLSFLFKFSLQTVSRCVSEVCNALIKELKNEIKLPKTPAEWHKIAKDFEEIWNFPHCVGAIDGKHIVMQCPIKSGSEFYNYKGTFSVVLLALVDANYCFTFVDIGCQGRISEGGVFRNSTLFVKLHENQLNLPPYESLPQKEVPVPYVFVGDDAFSLGPHIMKPYSGVYEKESVQRVFNYRLSRARRAVENVFGIMASVFRVFRKPMLIEPDKVSKITETRVLLHIFLRRSKSSSMIYTPQGTFDKEIDGEFIPGLWHNNESEINSLLPLRKVARKSGIEAKEIQESFAEYFVTNGAVPWQNNF